MCIRDRDTGSLMLRYRTPEGLFMPKYVIERELPGAGKLSKEQLHAISQKSCGVLNDLGPQIQWIESFVTDDKIYCIYRAPNEAMAVSYTHLRAHETPE